MRIKQKQFKPPRSLTRAFPQVKKVIHATQPVLVDVLPRDCTEGKKLQTDECALARAAKRQFKADGVAIRLSDSFIVNGDTAIRFATPDTVKRELVSFDRHKDFAAGMYRLSPARPEWARARANLPCHGGGHSPAGRNTNKAVHHRTVRVRTVNSEEAK